MKFMKNRTNKNPSPLATGSPASRAGATPAGHSSSARPVRPTGKGSFAILLKCPRCKRTLRTLRQPHDPPKAVRMELPCPKCDRPGTFPEPAYFDTFGKEVLYTEDGK